MSWRLRVLVWVLPGLLAVAGLLMLAWEGYRHLASTPTEGEVVRVYAWQGETVFDRGTTNYGPVFRYMWSDGEMTEATSGSSSPDFDFEIGSRHEIRYFPARKANVVLPGAHNWLPGLVILALAAVTAVPAFLLHVKVQRWLAGGAA
ncbi:DUF3592 domain-containing protein [Aliiruegeria haliotis]|uniref:DUF3592 domain-containing protein n=1 Tax=Aliiruegeria haliotis TaxID=1280846 RepID=UPI0011B1D193|nr:DUF3592 domain-containing protein [Aliiruegeria haliotis]